MEKNCRILLSSIMAAIAVISIAHASDEKDSTGYINAKAHLALPVEDIEKAKEFYTSVFQVPVHEGKTPDGKPVYALEIGPMVIAFNEVPKVDRNGVHCMSDEGKELPKVDDTYFVPCQHFGFFHLTPNEFEGIIERLKKKEAPFVLEPTVVNPNSDQEQLLAFVRDPQGYVIEIRASHSQRGFQPKEFEQQALENEKDRKF